MAEDNGNNENKPTLGDSLKAIGTAIGGEVDKYGGAKGIAGELFSKAKDAAVKAGGALEKAGDEAVRHVRDARADFARKAADAKKAETSADGVSGASAEPGEENEQEANARLEKELDELDEKERNLRSQLDSCQGKRDSIMKALHTETEKH